MVLYTLTLLGIYNVFANPFNGWIEPADIPIGPFQQQQQRQQLQTMQISPVWWMGVLDDTQETMIIYASLLAPPLIIGVGVRSSLKLRPGTRIVQVMCAVAVNTLVMLCLCSAIAYNAAVPRPSWYWLCRVQPVYSNNATNPTPAIGTLALPFATDGLRWTCPELLIGAVRDAKLAMPSTDAASAVLSAVLVLWATQLYIEDGWGIFAASALLHKPASALRSTRATTPLPATMYGNKSSAWRSTWQCGKHRGVMLLAMFASVGWGVYGVCHGWWTDRRSGIDTLVGVVIGATWSVITLGWYIPAVISYELEQAYNERSMLFDMRSSLDQRNNTSAFGRQYDDDDNGSELKSSLPMSRRE
jgi:hypothetical protein